MELKSGYKQTEVGEIPQDWSVVEIGEISTTSSGTTPARSQEERYFKNGEFHWIKTMDLNNSLIEDTEEKVTALALKETCLQMYPIGTVLVAMYGGFNQIGRTGLLGIVASVNQALVAIQLECNKVEPRFLSNTLNYRVEYWKSVASSSRKDPNITSNDVKHFKFPLPLTKTEQIAIANALSDADALIQSLTRLIAKKRQIKQGAMQTLLNPYENGQLKDGWEMKKLGDILESIQLGGNYVNSEVETDFPLIKMGNLGRGVINLAKIEYIKPRIAVAETDRLIREDVLFNTRNTLELVGKVAIWLDELPSAYFNSNIMRLKFKSNFVSSNVYMNSLLNHQRQIQQLKGMATGTTSVAAIYTRDLKGLEIPLAPKIEQLRIATILSDMDTEIAALETKLAKYRHIKQGMMQNLLTGRIRLVKPESKTGAVA